MSCTENRTHVTQYVHIQYVHMYVYHTQHTTSNNTQQHTERICAQSKESHLDGTREGAHRCVLWRCSKLWYGWGHMAINHASTTMEGGVTMGGGIHQSYVSETQCVSQSCADCKVHCIMRSGIYCSSHYSHFAMSTPDCALHIATTHIVSIGMVESHMNYDNV